MDNCCKRFPDVGKMILNNLNDQSLARSKKASRGIAVFLENERFYFVRIIRKYDEQFEGFEESWNEVINKTPIDFLKQLAVAVEDFFKENYWRKNLTPLHIAAEKDDLGLCEKIITKTSNKNPANPGVNISPKNENPSPRFLKSFTKQCIRQSSKRKGPFFYTFWQFCLGQH